jgi:hypothetical protein
MVLMCHFLKLSDLNYVHISLVHIYYLKKTVDFPAKIHGPTRSHSKSPSNRQLARGSNFHAAIEELRLCYQFKIIIVGFLLTDKKAVGPLTIGMATVC